MTEQWIPSDEGVKIYAQAGLSENTFFRHAREKRIKKSLLEEQERGALYSLEDITKIAERQRLRTKNRVEAIRKTNEEESKTDWVKTSDLPYLLALDYEMYGIDEAVDLSITHKWWNKNPYMCRILFDGKDRKNIWGYVSLLPMKEETILKILRREIHERDIRVEHILTYEKGGSYHVYAASIVTKPEHRSYIRNMLNSVLNYWCMQYPEIKISKVYAYAESDEGWNMIKHLFFAPRYDIGERTFELDLSRPNPSKIVTAFQHCLQERSR